MCLSKTLRILLSLCFLLSACIPQTSPTAPPPTPTLSPTPTRTPAALDQDAKSETWWRDAAVYEVFVRSFYDSNRDGIGDFNGLAQKLDYLSSLGVNTLWLMPIFPTRSYHGYDVTDYQATNPAYGSLDEFKALLAAAHQRGIKVIIDLVINHTSLEHPWFKAALANDPHYVDYYLWADSDPGYKGPWGETVWHAAANGRYYYAVFDPAMPDLNYRNPAVTQEMDKIADFWLKDVGVDGFRLDGAKHVIEDQRIQENTPETRAWLKAFRAHIKTVKPDALVVGEVWSPLTDIAPYIQDDNLDLAFNFPLADGILTGLRLGGAAKISSILDQSQSAFPDNRYGAFLANHDQTRVMTRVGDDLSRAKVAAAVLLTAPGVPFIYYGEEIGMSGDKPDEQIRNPMQWSAEPNAGFTSGTPWEAPKADYTSKNVAAQDTDPASLLNLYRQLLKLRGAHAALRTGAFVSVQASTPAVYSILRVAEKESVLVLINQSDQPVASPSLSWGKSALHGAYQPTVLSGAGQAAPLSVDATGGVKEYTPVAELPGNGIVIVQYKAK